MIYICNMLLALKKKKKKITCNTSQNLHFKAWPPCKSPCQITCRNNGASCYECSTLSLVTGHQSVSSEQKNSSKTELCWLLARVCGWFMCWRSKRAFVLLFGARNRCRVFDPDRGICTCSPAPAAERQQNRKTWTNALIPYGKRRRECLWPLECQTGAGNLSSAEAPGQTAGTRPSICPCPPTLQKGQKEPFPPNLQHWRFKSSAQPSGLCIIIYIAPVAYTYRGAERNHHLCSVTLGLSKLFFFFKLKK